MEQFINVNKALKEARKIEKIVGQDPDVRHYKLAHKYIEDTKVDNKRKTKQKEIKEFNVTTEMWVNALSYYHEHRDDLIKAAATSREHAVSHRNPPFKVGCAVMGIEPSNTKESSYRIYQAYNFRLETRPRTGRNKRCAERGGIEMAQENAKVVVAILTISKEKNTGDPTKAVDALHPCKECRDMYRKMIKNGFLKEDTIICSANDSNGEIVTEERTLKELLDLYNDDVV